MCVRRVQIKLLSPWIYYGLIVVVVKMMQEASINKLSNTKRNTIFGVLE